MARLKEFYKNEVAPALMKKFSYKSPMEIPRFDKVVVNVGCGDAKDNLKAIESICNDVAAITGQKPVVVKAKKSVANFKLREGMPVGVKVTLRGDRMFEFIDRLFNVALPRVRDSAASTPTGSTVAATMPSAFASSSFSPRSNTTRSIRSAAWTSPLSPPPRPTKRPVSCCP